MDVEYEVTINTAILFSTASECESVSRSREGGGQRQLNMILAGDKIP